MEQVVDQRPHLCQPHPPVRQVVEVEEPPSEVVERELGVEYRQVQVGVQQLELVREPREPDPPPPPRRRVVAELRPVLKEPQFPELVH